MTVEQYQTFVPGRPLLAGQLQALQMNTVEQGSELVLNNSATFIDTGIVMHVEAGATYMYWLLVGYALDGTSGAEDTSDITFAWATSGADVEVRRWEWGYGDTGSGSTNDFTSVNFRRPVTATDVVCGGSGSGVTNSYYEIGAFIGDDNIDGDAIFQFRQNTAASFDTSITGSSRIDYIRIAPSTVA